MGSDPLELHPAFQAWAQMSGGIRHQKRSGNQGCGGAPWQHIPSVGPMAKGRELPQSFSICERGSSKRGSRLRRGPRVSAHQSRLG